MPRYPVIGGLAGDHGADVAGMHAAHRFLIELAGSGLEIDQHHALLLGPLAARLGHRLAAGHVDGDRLGGVDVAAGIDAGHAPAPDGSKAGYDDDGIRPGVQHPLVARQAAEGAILGHAQPLGRGLGAIGKIVRRGHELVSAMLLEQVGDPISPRAAPDQAERDLGVRFRGRDLLRFGDQKSRGSGGCSRQKIAAADVVVTGGVILGNTRVHGWRSFDTWGMDLAGGTVAGEIQK